MNQLGNSTSHQMLNDVVINADHVKHTADKNCALPC